MLKRCVAGNGDAVHAAALIGKVTQSAMLDATIVPDSHRARLPAEPAGELRPDRVFAQERQDGGGFLIIEVDQGLCVGADVERFFAGFWMRTQ